MNRRDVNRMSASTARLLHPTFEDFEVARQELYEALAESEGQPEDTMRSADAVFSEKRRKLEVLLDAKV